MEIAARSSRPAWTCPTWLAPRFISDARFARAYDALGDQRRAKLKGLIADHFALTPPVQSHGAQCSQHFVSGLSRHACTMPRPFVLLLTDASLDAPALFLAALMPALCSGAGEVLVLRLGARPGQPNGPPDALLTACELAGQERVAAVSPTLALRLLSECAQSGLPGLVLYPDTPVLRRLFARPELRDQLDASALRLAPLRLPRALGLWRDSPGQYDPAVLEFLYGALAFEAGGATPGRRTGKSLNDATIKAAFSAFAAPRRDLLLVPEQRLSAGQGAARLVVGESHVGLWTWPELTPELFASLTQALGSAPAPLS
ncbi:MAG: hypothetical protein KKF77_02455 [Proteobacteria bacterium]|nr:hypothetical protein [Pseudomonadota bacterium]